MEAEATRDDLGTELDRIERAVAAGNTDLRTLGLWRVVARVKPDPRLVDQHADQIGRIDTAAFRAAVRMRVPVWAGLLLLAGAIGVGVLAAWIALEAIDPDVRGLALLAAGVIWAIGVHSPTHWLVGRAVGMRFTDVFLGGPPPPRPGIKTDYATYLRVDAHGRAWMHASGAIATKLAPFAALALWPASGAPGWAAVGLLIIGVGQVVTDVTFSTKSSDWKKFSREMAIARAARAGPAAPSP